MILDYNTKLHRFIGCYIGIQSKHHLPYLYLLAQISIHLPDLPLISYNNISCDVNRCSVQRNRQRRAAECGSSPSRSCQSVPESPRAQLCVKCCECVVMRQCHGERSLVGVASGKSLLLFYYLSQNTTILPFLAILTFLLSSVQLRISHCF